MKPVHKLSYAMPAVDATRRSAGRMLADVTIGLVMVAFGFGFLLVAVIVDRRDTFEGFWDRLCNLVPNGLSKIVHGKYRARRESVKW